MLDSYRSTSGCIRLSISSVNRMSGTHSAAAVVVLAAEAPGNLAVAAVVFVAHSVAIPAVLAAVEVPGNPAVLAAVEVVDIPVGAVADNPADPRIEAAVVVRVSCNPGSCCSTSFDTAG